MTREETETIIRWDLSEDVAYIYTCQKGIWLKLERYGYEAGEVIHDPEGRVISKEFTVPKAVISLRKGKRKFTHLPGNRRKSPGGSQLGAVADELPKDIP